MQLIFFTFLVFTSFSKIILKLGNLGNNKSRKRWKLVERFYFEHTQINLDVNMQCFKHLAVMEDKNKLCIMLTDT